MIEALQVLEEVREDIHKEFNRQDSRADRRLEHGRCVAGADGQCTGLEKALKIVENKIRELKITSGVTTIYYMVQAYHREVDVEYSRHLYPAYLTSYDKVKGGKNFGLQSGLRDALKFTSEETAMEWQQYAAEVFKDRAWEVVPVDSRLLGKVKPIYVIEEEVVK